ncbi:hypothetical protein [Streptomyces sp. NPDC050264]
MGGVVPEAAFEPAAGHWPMLCAPHDVAKVLVRAVADEGERVPPAAPPAG